MRYYSHLAMGPWGEVYLIHLDEPLGNQKHEAQHYTGFAPTKATARFPDHGGPHGARMLEVARERGITFRLVATWPGTRTVERALKNHGATGRCPECNPQATTPRLVRWALAAREKLQAKQESQQEAQEREAKPMAPHTSAQRYAAGAHTAARMTDQFLNAGYSADKIERQHEQMTAPAYERPMSAKQQAGHGGYTAQVESDLTLLREMERDDEEAAAALREEREAANAVPEGKYVDFLTAQADRQEAQREAQREAPREPWELTADEMAELEAG